MTRDTFDMFAPPERGRFGDNEHRPKGPRVTGASDLHDIDVVLHHETAAAILISLDGREANAKWLPKSWVEISRGQLETGAQRRSGQLVRLPVITVTLPERQAREKGLL